MNVLATLLLLCLPASGAITESKALKGVLIDDRGQSKEAAFLERGLKKIAQSGTAKILEERRNRLGPVLVRFAKLDTSTVAFSGAHGNTDIHQATMTVNVNEEVLKSSHSFVETLAHELYGHGILLKEKVYEDADIGHTIYNEGWALALGAIIALEAGEPIDEEYRIDAITASTRAYAAEVMFLDSKEARIEFSLEEAKDPAKAIKARLNEIKRRRKSVEERRQDSLVWRQRLEHFTKVHRLDPAQVKELYDSVDATLNVTLPDQKAMLETAEKHLKSVLDYFKEPEGQLWVERMKELSRTDYLRNVAKMFAIMGLRLQELRAAPPAAPAVVEAPPKTIGWAELDEMTAKDLVENPGHWKGVPPPSGRRAEPWVLP